MCSIGIKTGRTTNFHCDLDLLASTTAAHLYQSWRLGADGRRLATWPPDFEDSHRESWNRVGSQEWPLLIARDAANVIYLAALLLETGITMMDPRPLVPMPEPIHIWIRKR
jgi:hypothetical protein